MEFPKSWSQDENDKFTIEETSFGAAVGENDDLELRSDHSRLDQEVAGLFVADHSSIIDPLLPQVDKHFQSSCHHVEMMTPSAERMILWRQVMIVISLVSFWYTFSIGLTFYNKWLFKVHFFAISLYFHC